MLAAEDQAWCKEVRLRLSRADLPSCSRGSMLLANKVSHAEALAILLIGIDTSGGCTYTGVRY